MFLRKNGYSCFLAICISVFLLSELEETFAGGYDTGERDWDFLFQQDAISFEAGTRYINPRRKIRNVTNLNPFLPTPPTSTLVNETAPFSVTRFSLAMHLGEYVNCLGSYREPWGGDADYGSSWAGSFSAIEQNFSSQDLGLTCSLHAPVTRGELHLIGGISYQEIEYELTRNSQFGFSRTLVSDSALAWRVGLAYEIPEYALRASLIYNSQVDYDTEGTVSFANIPFPTNAFGRISLPQSLDFKFQSGVAPGWLAFGMIKWTDWSVTDAMPICPVGTPVCNQAAAISGLTLLWRDSWTLTAGAAHQFSKEFSLAGNITWDQGTSMGFTSLTDSWSVGLTAILTPNKNMEIKLGGTAGFLTSGSLSTATLQNGFPNPVGYTANFGNDFLYSLNISGKYQF